MRKKTFKLLLSVGITFSIIFSGIGQTNTEVHAAELENEVTEESSDEITLSPAVETVALEPEQLYTLEDNGDILSERIERSSFNLLDEQAEEMSEVAETTGIYDMAGQLVI